MIDGKRQDEVKAEPDPNIQVTLFKALKQMMMIGMINMSATSDREKN